MAEYKTDEGKLKEVCSVLKALLTSYGGELPMNQIDGEYHTVVGRSIPYKAMKHGSLASFLQSIPSVLRLQNRGGKLVVTVVNDDNIDMILQQVKYQNNSKNKTVQKKKKYTEFATRQLHANPGTPPLHTTHWQNNTNWHPPSWRTPTIPTRTNFHIRPLFPHQAQSRTTDVNLQPPPGFINRLQQPPPGTRSRFSQNAIHKVATQQPSDSQATAKEEKPTTSVCNKSLKTKAPAAEQSYKLQLIDAAKELEVKAPAGERRYKQQLIEAAKELEAELGKSGDDKIDLQFKTLRCGKMMEWVSVIIIGNTRVSNYPDLSSSLEEAEEAASKKGLELLPQLIKDKQGVQLPNTNDFNVSVPRVKQLLKQRSPNKPFWWEPLRDIYCQVYKETLPLHWLSIARGLGNTGLLFDNPCVDKWTVALAEQSQAQAPQSTTKPQVTSAHQEFNTPSPSPPNGKTEGSDSTRSGQKAQLPPLSLPNTPTWDVFITCVEDGNTLQLLLVGDKYTSMYNELLTDMELHYMEEKNQKPVKDPVVGEIYIASHEESWLRVKLVEVLGDEVKVKFVDHGDVEAIPLASLYYLQKNFFSLPPQALQCCLAGLEDAPEEAAFQSLMETIPMGKTLVARVQRRQEPYAIVLFDTSTNEDVNLNEKVFGSLALNLVEPSLPPVGGVAEVYLTHASSEGTLYIQMESKTYKVLEDLLNIAKRRTEEMLGEKVQLDLTKLYLARFSKDGEWYRAAPRSKVDPKGQVLMRFVDFGNTEKVPLNNLRGLQAMSPLLEKVPLQALPCCLHNVPNNPKLKWTVEACQRLMDLASADTPVLLKVVSEGTATQPPSVQLFKRLMPQNELVSINDILGIDTKLFGSEGDSNNNSVEKEVVLSQFRSQQSSCASGAISKSLPSELPPVGPDSFPPCSSLTLRDIPDEGTYFDVFVTFAANPYHFAVQPWTMGKAFDEMWLNFENYYQNPANLKRVEAIECGQYCALYHSDDIWYRAKVEAVLDGSVAGVFVDFGDRFYATLDKVQPLAPQFCTLPCLAIKAELCGIKAANEDWSPEDACRFRELAGNKNLVSTVHKKRVTEDRSLFLSLDLVDTSDKTNDVYIEEVLVKEHRAKYIAKSSTPLSKLN